MTALPTRAARIIMHASNHPVHTLLAGELDAAIASELSAECRATGRLPARRANPPRCPHPAHLRAPISANPAAPASRLPFPDSTAAQKDGTLASAMVVQRITSTGKCARVMATGPFRRGLAIGLACLALPLGCAHHADPSDVAAPSATGTSNGAQADDPAHSGPTVAAALRLHLVTPPPTVPATTRVRVVTRADLRKQLDTAKSLLARAEKSDNSWYDDERPALAAADKVARRTQKASDAVAKDVMTNLVQGEDFLYDAAAAAKCGRRDATARQDATAYLRAAHAYIEMAARDLTHNMPNPADWSAPVPEVHEEEGQGCGE